MNLVKFTTTEGKTIYINPNAIQDVYPEAVCTHIQFIGANSYVKIIESEDQVIEKLYGTKLNNLTRTGNYDRL